MALPLALIPLALSIAEIAAPTLGRWIGGTGGEKVARQVVDTAQAVTGRSEPAEIQAALRADPALLVDLQRHLASVELELYRAETERLAIVNRTMQAEVVSGDRYVSRWRPTMGYALTGTWVLTMCGIVGALVYAIVAVPERAGEIISAMSAALGALTVMWSVALAVLGIGVAKRSEDKKVAAGLPQAGLVQALASRIGGAAR